jgi:3alpha(or 20beta)-hydroxysteroid dehydrogenase
MTDRLAGKVALVSGGARGMGASHVRSLVAQGAKVVFGDILDAEGEVVAKEVGDRTRYLHLDVTQPDDWERAVSLAVDEFGGVDVLVNNAGIINVGLIEDYELSEWQRILDINLTGVFLGIRAVTPTMKAAGRGSSRSRIWSSTSPATSPATRQARSSWSTAGAWRASATRTSPRSRSTSNRIG